MQITNQLPGRSSYAQAVKPDTAMATDMRQIVFYGIPEPDEHRHVDTNADIRKSALRLYRRWRVVYCLNTLYRRYRSRCTSLYSLRPGQHHLWCRHLRQTAGIPAQISGIGFRRTCLRQPASFRTPTRPAPPRAGHHFPAPSHLWRQDPNYRFPLDPTFDPAIRTPDRTIVAKNLRTRALRPDQ